MYNRRYHKSYWMMQQETTGYGLQQGTPWGSCVMEIKNGKGRLVVTVEALLPLRKGHYGIYVALEAKDKKEAAFCGKLNPDHNGHGIIQWDFSPDNLPGGYLAEDIFAVVMLAEETGQQGLPAPLTAYPEEKRNWRTAFSQKPIEEKKEKLEQELEDIVTLQAAETIRPTRESVPEEQHTQKILQKDSEKEKIDIVSEESKKSQETSPLLEEGVHGSFRGLLQKFRQEMNQLEEMGILTAEESRQIQGISESQNDIEEDEIPAQRQEDITEMTRTEARIQLAQANIDADRQKEEFYQEMVQEKQEDWIFADHPAIYPFEDGEKWVCIQPEEMVLLEEAPPHWQTDFFYLLPWHRDKHFIVKQEGTEIFLGIPDTYSPAEQKRAEEHGFTTFRYIEGSQNLGYWIGKIQR